MNIVKKNMSILIIFLGIYFNFIFISEDFHLFASTNKGLETQSIIKAIERKLLHYYEISGEFPSTKEGLDPVIKKQASYTGLKYNTVFMDSWGNELIYIHPSKYGNKPFDLYSMGQNMKNDYGKRDDITNWTEFSRKNYFPSWRILQKIILFLLIVFIFVFWRIIRQSKTSL